MKGRLHFCDRGCTVVRGADEESPLSGATDWHRGDVLSDHLTRLIVVVEPVTGAPGVRTPSRSEGWGAHGRGCMGAVPSRIMTVTHPPTAPRREMRATVEGGAVPAATARRATIHAYSPQHHYTGYRAGPTSRAGDDAVTSRHL